MLSTLGLILLGFAGFSAAFLLFVFLFGDKGTFINLTKSPTSTGFPVTSFPATNVTGVTATDSLDLELTTMGMIFVYGGALATIIAAVMFFVAPWAILDKCKTCASCNEKPCPCPAPTNCGCPV